MTRRPDPPGYRSVSSNFRVSLLASLYLQQGWEKERAQKQARAIQRALNTLDIAQKRNQHRYHKICRVLSDLLSDVSL